MFSEEFAAVAGASQKKAELLRQNFIGYFISSMLAGIYVGFGIILSFSIGGLLSAAQSPVLKMVMGLAFGVALSLVIMAGAELFTGNAFVMAAGLLKKSVTWVGTAWLWLVCYAGNLAGSVLLAYLYFLTGLDSGPVDQFIASTAAMKMSLPFGQLFFRGVLCNILVCLAVWCSYRLKSEAAKLIMVFWCIFVFITSGFEHSVANMTLLAIALFNPGTAAVSISGYVYNLLVVTFGNFVGAIVFLALPYFSISRIRNDKPAEVKERSAGDFRNR
jgi:nitrite transporter